MATHPRRIFSDNFEPLRNAVQHVLRDADGELSPGQDVLVLHLGPT